MKAARAASLSIAVRLVAGLAAIGLLTGSVVVSCAGDPSSSTGSGSNAPASQSLGRWTPSTADTCTQALHDTYFVIGPDGKKYPTWHPPEVIDPDTNQTCSFGHDHGTDPRNSALWPDLQQHFAFDANNNGVIDANELAVSGIPFGLVSEKLVGSATPRLEDHTGYKVLWQNNVVRTLASGPPGFDLTCNLLAAYNQATSSADAFASNLFSVTYAVDCNGGSSRAQFPAKVIASVMAVYGDPGSFAIDRNGTQQSAGVPADPASSPFGGGELGRLIAESIGVFTRVFVPTGQLADFDGALSERWETQLRLRRANNTELATLVPALVIADPSRYWGGAGLARTIELCYSGLDAAGNLITDPLFAANIVRQARGVPCSTIAPNGPATPANNRVAFDDPASPFKACRSSAGFGADAVRNAAGPTLWYTDAFGGNASQVAFANSVKQFVAAVDTGTVTLAEATVARQECRADSVHVPN